METLLGKIKDTLVAAQGSTLSYVTKIKIVAPFLPVIDLGQMPFIGIAPISSPETWVTTGKKEVKSTKNNFPKDSYVGKSFLFL